jgi:DNA-binding transcriptional ArsR family regulator
MAYAAVLSALSDPTRRRILEELRKGPSPVGELARQVPVSRPAVSQHLRILKDAGLVKDRTDGTRRIYRVDPAGLLELRRYLDGFWDDVLTHFQEAADHADRTHPKAGDRPARSR